MKLRSLKLHLFRQHVESELNLGDGLTGILGANGAGKTTIVEAISFALFGSRAIRGKIEELRTRGMRGQRVGTTKADNEPRVELTIEHDGNVFRIDRSLSDAQIFAGGEPEAIATGNREVSAKISNLLGMSYEEFTATYCTEQKGLEFLGGKKGAAERERFIVRMMGFDRLEEVQEALRSDRKEKRSVLAGFEASLGTREDLEIQLKQEEKALAEIQIEQKKSSEMLAKAEQDFSDQKKRMDIAESVRTKYVKVETAERDILIRLEDRKKRTEKRSQEKALLLEKVQSICGKESKMEEVLTERKKRTSVLEKLFRSQEEELRNIETAAKEKIAALKANLETAEANRKKLEIQKKSIKSLDTRSPCPTCGQPLGRSFSEVKEHAAKELADATALVGSITKELTAANKATDQILKLRKEVIITGEKLDSLRKEFAELERFGIEFERISTEEKILNEELRKFEKELEGYTAKKKELKFSEKQYLSEKGAFDASQRLVEVQRLQKVRADGELQTKQVLVKRTRADLDRFDEKIDQQKNLARELKILDEADKILTDFRKHLNDGLRPRLSELASEYLADLTDGRYTSIDLGPDFTPTVLEDGEPKAVISGGEEDILNLCMRIALSHMIAERAGHTFSLLMLDEVFGSLDEGRRTNVLTLLEKLSKRFEQILIITHLEDIKESVEHPVYIDYDEATGFARIDAAQVHDTAERVAFNY